MLFAVRRANDEELLASAGHSIASLTDRESTLTPREREICNLVSNGLSNREIARLLYISEGTVKTHLHNIFEKLGVKSRRALVRGNTERRLG